MVLSQYAKNKGMQYAEYKQLEANIKSTASGIIAYIKSMYIIDDGIYHESKEIPALYNNYDWKPYLLQELKNMGMEFIENNTMWRI